MNFIAERLSLSIRVFFFLPIPIKYLILLRFSVSISAFRYHIINGRLVLGNLGKSGYDSFCPKWTIDYDPINASAVFSQACLITFH